MEVTKESVQRIIASRGSQKGILTLAASNSFKDFVFSKTYQNMDTFGNDTTEYKLAYEVRNHEILVYRLTWYYRETKDKEGKTRKTLIHKFDKISKFKKFEILDFINTALPVITGNKETEFVESNDFLEFLVSLENSLEVGKENYALRGVISDKERQETLLKWKEEERKQNLLEARQARKKACLVEKFAVKRKQALQSYLEKRQNREIMRLEANESLRPIQEWYSKRLEKKIASILQAAKGKSSRVEYNRLREHWNKEKASLILIFQESLLQKMYRRVKEFYNGNDKA